MCVCGGGGGVVVGKGLCPRYKIQRVGGDNAHVVKTSGEYYVLAKFMGEVISTYTKMSIFFYLGVY